MCHVSCVTCHVSCHVICHVSYVMCHVSCVMCHVSCQMSNRQVRLDSRLETRDSNCHIPPLGVPRSVCKRGTTTSTVYRLHHVSRVTCMWVYLRPFPRAVTRPAPRNSRNSPYNLQRCSVLGWEPHPLIEKNSSMRLPSGRSSNFRQQAGYSARREAHRSTALTAAAATTTGPKGHSPLSVYSISP